MKNRYYAIISLLILLPSCFFNSKESASTQTYFIQAPLDLATVKEFQDSMQPAIEKILQEELGTTDYIEGDQRWVLFFFKRRQAITTYYVNDLLEDGKEFLFSALEDLKSLPSAKKAMLSSDLRFFGDENSKMIDLVMIINDPEKELELLNKETKKAAHQASEKYRDIHQDNLYDIAKSERFPYLPHLSLGHLRSNAIKELIKDSAKKEETLERIKERIIKALSDKLTELLTPETNKISFNSLSIYDAKQREYIKDFPLDG